MTSEEEEFTRERKAKIPLLRGWSMHYAKIHIAVLAAATADACLSEPPMQLGPKGQGANEHQPPPFMRLVLLPKQT